MFYYQACGELDCRWGSFQPFESTLLKERHSLKLSGNWALEFDTLGLDQSTIISGFWKIKALSLKNAWQRPVFTDAFYPISQILS